MTPIHVEITPRLREATKLPDLLARIAWAGAGRAVEVSGLGQFSTQEAIPEYFDPEVAQLLPLVRPSCGPGPEEGVVWLTAEDEEGRKHRGNAFVADPAHTSEGKDMAALRYHVERERRPEMLAESIAKFRRLRIRWGGYSKSYVVATGPSFSEYERIDDFEDAFVVTCNSAVINEDFMKKAKPDLLVFGDPIFHFGPSQYAADFRAKLKEAAARNDFAIAVTEKYYFLYQHCFPELMDRTLFVPANHFREEYHWRLAEQFEVKTTQNILTLLMLPFAAEFARRIEILGCDGRPLAEDSYFWGHNPGAQINEKMQNIQEAHPGFFHIDFNDYYLRHCVSLEQFFSSLEEARYVIRSVGKSYIPALGLRADEERRKEVDPGLCDATSSEEKRRVKQAVGALDLSDNPIGFVSINPSLRNGMGHALYQDRSLRELVAESGKEFVSLGHAELSEDLRGQFIVPAFEIGTWQVHRQFDERRASMAESFVSELMNGLEILAERYSLSEATLFFYMGHPAMVPALLRRWRRKKFSCGRFVFNLFSGYFHPPSNSADQGALAAAAGITEMSSDCSDLRIVCDSQPFADDLWSFHRVLLPVLPMCPSQELSGKKPDEEKEIIRVVYPSQSEEIRGYFVIWEFLKEFAERYDGEIEFIIRSHAPWRKTAPARVERNNVVWVEGELRENEYQNLLSSADIILLPYSPEAFYYRTSSILAEAFSLNKPVVAVSGAWLGDEVSRASAGWLIEGWSAEGLKNTFDRIVREKESLNTGQMERAVQAWCEANSVDRFLDAVQSPQKALVEDPEAILETLASRQLFPADQSGGVSSLSSFDLLFRVKVIAMEKIGPGGKRVARRIANPLYRIWGKGRRWLHRSAGKSLSGRRGRRKPPVQRIPEMFLRSQKPGEFPWNSLALVDRCLSHGSGGKRPVCSGSLPDDSLIPSRWQRSEAAVEDGPHVKCVDLPGQGGVLSEESPDVLVATLSLGCESDLYGIQKKGYQVWIAQLHPEADSAMSGSLYRFFPYPSFPISEDVVSAAVCLKEWIRHIDMDGIVKELSLNREE